MPKKNHTTIETSNYELQQAANWLLTKYSPRTKGTIVTGPRSSSLILKDRQFASLLGKKLQKASKRKRSSKIFSIEISKELVNWFAQQAHVDLFMMRIVRIEHNHITPKSVPALAYSCLDTIRHRVGKPRLTEKEIETRLGVDIPYDERYIRRLRARKREHDKFLEPLRKPFLKKTP